MQTLLAAAMRYHHLGQLAQAEAGYRRILALDPQQPDALHMLGVVTLQQGNADAALPLLRRASQRRPKDAAIRLNLGLCLRALNRLDDARHSLQRALKLQPDLHVARFNLGGVCRALGDDNAAADHYRALLTTRPDDASVYNELGLLEKQRGRWRDALALFERGLQSSPDHVELLNNRANLLQLTGDPQRAVVDYRRALASEPDNLALRGNLANALLELGDIAAAADGYQQVLDGQPELAQAHYHLANARLAAGRLDAAIDGYRAALRRDATLPQIHNNLGTALLLRDDPAAAADSFAAALRCDSGYLAALDNLCDARLRLCDWRELDTLTERLLAASRPQADGGAGYPARPFVIARLPRDVAAAERQRIARAAVRQRVPLRPEPLYRADAAGGEADAVDAATLRIGYVSTDFNNHATSHLIRALFALHDRSRYEIYGYSLGRDDGSAYRREVEQGCDTFRELAGQPPAAAAARIAADRIGILIDLNGHSANNRIELFAYRPAPLQIAYLGFPGTSGADFFDYILTDATVTPSDRQRYYDERFITLPHSYQVNSPRADDSDTAANAPNDRAAHGLPDEAMVFCCFNNAYKIEPLIFGRWLAVLRALPDSVLWLLGGPPATRNNLRRAAVDGGVAAERLVFAERLPTAAHLVRHRHADLFLDTYFYNAHTTASDALWCGLPVLTCPGDSFAARVGASLNRAVGLDQLNVATLDDYERTALALARDRRRLAALRRHLLDGRDRHPLFDTAGFAARLDRVYAAIWQRYRDGLPPAPLDAAAL